MESFILFLPVLFLPSAKKGKQKKGKQKKRETKKNMIHDHDKSICKWSVQKDGYCPFEEILNKLVNSHVEKKIRCKSKECLYIILDKTGLKNEREVIEKYEPDMLKPRGPLSAEEMLSNINIDDVLHDFAIASIPKKGESNIFVNGPFFHIPLFPQ
jgi:hypothetical protein